MSFHVRRILHCYMTESQRRHDGVALQRLGHKFGPYCYESVTPDGTVHNHFVLRKERQTRLIRGMVYESVEGLENVPAELRPLVLSRVRPSKHGT